MAKKGDVGSSGVQEKEETRGESCGREGRKRGQISSKYVRMYICTYVVHAYIRTYVHMYICTYVVHAYIRTYVRMYICTYVSTYVCIYSGTWLVITNSGQLRDSIT